MPTFLFSPPGPIPPVMIMDGGGMPALDLMAVPVATSPAEGWPCSWEDCPRPAVIAMRFHKQPGHVHECSSHAAELREWCDVAESAPLPCPWIHGATWTDTPRDLEV